MVHMWYRRSTRDVSRSIVDPSVVEYVFEYQYGTISFAQVLLLWGSVADSFKRCEFKLRH